jgi:hypothetical protein
MVKKEIAAQKSDKSEITPNKWSIRRRMEFIDFRLSVEGKINRSDLVNFFGISVPQSSLDFSLYRELVKNCKPSRENLRYDVHKKLYVRTDDFKPVFPEECSPDHFLEDLALVSRDSLSDSRNFFNGRFPVAAATLVPPKRKVEAKLLFNLIDAINEHMAMHIVYMSLSQGKYMDYLIAPHSFAYDGFRWHIRAYCYDRHEFRDYVLSRIKSSDTPKIMAPNDRFPDPLGNGFREVGTDAASDADWNEKVVLKLKINPELSENERNVLALDYGIGNNGYIEHEVRKALLFYAVRNLKLTEDYKKLPAIERQLVLDNEKEIFSLLKTK